MNENKMAKWLQEYDKDTLIELYSQQHFDMMAQLAEKDKEIERIKQIAIDINRDNNQLRESLGEYSKVNMPAVLANRENKQYQNQKAIEELEKIKSYIRSEIEDAKALLDPIEYEDYHELLGVIRGYKLSLEWVDNRIKELKGE